MLAKHSPSHPADGSPSPRCLLGVLLVAGLGLAGIFPVADLMAPGRPLAAKEPETKPAAAKEAAANEPLPARAAEPGHAAAADPASPRGKADRAAIDELRELAEKAFQETFDYYEAGDALPTEVYRWSMVWLHYEMELASDDAKRIAATQDHLERMMNLANVGLWRSRELEFYVAEAEWLFDRAQPHPAFAATIAARKKLQGQWDVESIEEDGTKQTRLDIKSITIVGRRATFEHRLGTAKAFLALDPLTEPASIDILGTNEEFPFGGLGIYKLDGDTLTLCWGNAGERPKDFATKAGDHETLVVLRKAK